MRIVALGCVTAAALILALPAQAATMSECAAQWKAAKAAKQTEGKSYREFSRACMGGSAKANTKADPATRSDLAKEAGASEVGKPSSATKASKTETGGKTSTRKSSAASRQKACGAEWKADKAAGKVEKGMTWPKYWSACSKRKKAESA